MGFMQLHLALSYRQCFTMPCSVRPDLPNSPQSDSFLLRVGYIVTAAAVSLLWVQSWLFIKGYVHRRTSESPGQVLICLLTVNRTMTTVLRAVWIITVFRAHWKNRAGCAFFSIAPSCLQEMYVLPAFASYEGVFC